MTLQNYCAMGDSITDPSNQLVKKWYHDWLKDWWQPNQVSLLAVSGATINADYASMAQSCRLIPANCDRLTIYGGINDFGMSQPLGQLGNSDNITFYGALDQLLRRVLQAHPQMAVYFVSHVKIGHDFFPTTNQLGLQQAAYEEAIAAVTAAYSVPHLSLYRSWLNFADPVMAAQYSIDSLHPNDAGQLVIAHMIDEFVQTH